VLGRETRKGKNVSVRRRGKKPHIKTEGEKIFRDRIIGSKNPCPIGLRKMLWEGAG